MKNINKQQRIQESRYKFPYHYIPSFINGNFNQVISLRWGYIYLSNLYFLIKKINSIKFDSLLDVGCGDGRFLYELSLKYPNKELLGLDYSEKAIKFAIAMNPRVKFICADFLKDKLLFKKNFDIITLIETLEHIPLNLVKKFIEKLSIYLKDTGMLIITVPNKNIALSPKHFQHFDLEDLKNTLHHQFTIVETHYLNKNSKIVENINKLFINKYFIINQMRLKNIFYRKYVKNFLYANEKNARRIFVLCEKI